MSQRAALWWLWIGASILLPVPFFLVETGFVPVARLLMLGGATLALIAVEGPQGTAGTVAALLFTQAALYLAALWLTATAFTRLLRQRSPGQIATITVLVLLLGLTLASTFEIYHTPFRTKSLQANLWQVYE